MNKLYSFSPLPWKFLLIPRPKPSRCLLSRCFVNDFNYAIYTIFYSNRSL